ncbi:hypothetical protein JTE90_018655 [Oedothorax gibbosus]|uniref:Sec1-like protein n=1 Tax=Oedothorax gibbosus TaxID=931172 RepID=A0AAV6UEG0_9ARAC|nr:hypothetical protein JTE90_018655 [Oedothorax gibbosus]
MPFNKGSSGTGIRNICRQKLLDRVFLANKVEHEWKVLVVDDFAMKVVSSCFKTEEILAYNIALIETLEEVREPLLYFEAIYMLQPTKESIKHLKVDLNPTGQMYKNGHLVFLDAVPDDTFEGLSKTLSSDMVKSLIEIDVMFLPRESQVYSLQDPLFYSAYFDALKDVNASHFELTAKKLVTLFSTLNVIPFIRYRRNFIKNLILAETIEKELKLQKHLFKDLTAMKASKKTCILLILDRGFDCISPIVHDFTFQAMAYDLLNIEDDIYEFITGYAEGKTVQSISLSAEDSLWCKIRHEHIASVTKIIQSIFEADDLLKSTKHISSGVLDLPSMNEALKKHLQLKTHERFFAYRHMANEIMKIYCDGINLVYELEQTLATRTDSEQRKASDMYESVTEAIRNSNVDLPEKLRLLLLYIFYHKGIKESKFKDMLKKTEIPVSEANTITNVLHFDIDLFKPGYCEPLDSKVPKKEIETAPRYKQSRWNPVINDIMIGCIDGTLSEGAYPYLKEKPDVTFKRTGYWCSDKKLDNVSHLVVFIAGGVTYSEIRCAYEVMSKYKGWDIFIGGDDIITPDIFIEKLKELPSFIS